MQQIISITMRIFSSVFIVANLLIFDFTCSTRLNAVCQQGATHKKKRTEKNRSFFVDSIKKLCYNANQATGVNLVGGQHFRYKGGDFMRIEFIILDLLLQAGYITSFRVTKDKIYVTIKNDRPQFGSFGGHLLIFQANR